MSTVKVRFKVKDPDVCGFIVANTKGSAELFEFREYAVIELEIDREKDGAPIVSARFIGKKSK